MRIKTHHGFVKMLVLLAALLLAVAGCSSSGGSGGGGGGGTTPGTLAITLSSSAASVSINGTVTITARVTEEGSAVDDGTAVSFQVAPTYGSMNPTASVTSSGLATATFTAASTPGTAQITATSGGAIATINVAVTQTASSDLAAIALVATQSSINPDETSTLTAMAYNASGVGVAGAVLVFTVDNPTLGYVTETATTGTDGTATATFTARSNPGTVNVTATSGGVSSSSRAITILDQTSPANVVLSASATSVTVTNTVTISATVTDGTGTPVDNGTTVSFEVTNDTYGTITASGITNAGVASATFTASSNPGVATIRATSGSAEDTINITVSPVSAASITFVSVSQNPIAIRGTGVNEFAIITFDVKDVNGNPAQDIDVLFTLDGPGGGEYIEDNDATPTVQTVGTSDGVAEITLYSGTEPGPVTLFASITTAGGDTITAATPIISIGGGVPTDKWLSVAAEQRNLAGWEYNDIETLLTAYLADRFGNYNVLNGYSVSFQSEIGLALYSTNATADELGTATVRVRTQKSSYGEPSETVAEAAWETLMKADITTRYGVTLTGHPRNGVCSVLVYTSGEEHFQDGSSGYPRNGLYDTGETFTDTADDPFVDYNDDGLWDDGSSDPFEDFVDPPKDGWDGVNGVWDSDKYIFRNYEFLVTGEPQIYAYVMDQDGDGINDSSFVVETPGSGNDLNSDGDDTDNSATIFFLICDDNYNPPCIDSAFTVEVGAGEIVGQTEWVYPDIADPGSDIEFSATVMDDDPADVDPEKFTSVDITVDWVTPNGTLSKTVSIYGWVD